VPSRILLLTIVLAVAAGCSSAASRTLDLTPQNDSGVQGTVTLTDLGSGRTRVTIAVDPAGNPDMPAHIHAGTCDAMIPQPQFALVNIIDGKSTTEIATSLDALLASEVAINLHQSNGAMKVSTACAAVPD
jgi:hypothetical protein